MPKSEEKRKPRPGKGKKNESLELLRAITKSMAGAVPGISQETRDLIDDSLARPLSGAASQIMGSDLQTGETYFPPVENLKRSWNADERRRQGLPQQPKIMPGMIPDTMSLPAQFSENAPEWSQEAKRVSEITGGNIEESMGLDPAQGFRQHALESAGIMGAQVPMVGRSKQVADIGKGALHLAKKYGMKALKSPVEFLSPTIDPKMSNYLFGTAAGGSLGALGDEPEEVIEEMPPPRAISRAKGGKVGALTKFLKTISMNPDARAKQTSYQIGDPVEEVLYATNEGLNRGVLSSDEAKRIKLLLEAGEEDQLSEALMDLHSRLNPKADPEPTLQKLPPWEDLVFQDKGYREPVHGKGKMTQEEWDQMLQKKSKGGKIKSVVDITKRLANRRGAFKNSDVQVPQGFSRFEVQKLPGGAGRVIGIRADGTRKDLGVSTLEVADALASSYNTGGYDSKGLRKIPLSDPFSE